ncbi:zinc metalloprotease [Nocardioides euryhalodurans]|uniref:Zinc metalloprotease n=1 Tax=Nocardioides euryhalodurans TaxID=2518370 RepID=A0A4P7GPS8_9ACTN|nr:zinc metalloprotease [Nocardioides euryhalodurans]QBR94123.1 zinc metalloprotease [Nocardioides euryhalodurans]
MRTTTTGLRRTAASAMVAGLALVGLTAPAASAAVVAGEPVCVEVDAHEASSAARGGYGNDTRPVTPTEQRQIRERTSRILDRQVSRGRPAAGTSIPVYVHVMAAKDGSGDVTDAAIAEQVAVLNTTYAGEESGAAAETGYTFRLAGVDRFYNDTWHRDGASSKYRKATRQGGANALNMWLVDFKYLGIATFPWDYAKSPGVDGIRVHYATLPGGAIENYDLGETATHEAGHWLGLYHTFQGGCTELNDEVADTPAQSSPTDGCPEGRDSCSLPGLDPIHNYMDYSYDTCYTQFTPGQDARMDQMWAAYRG